MFCILVLESMSHSVTFLFQSDVTCFSILICCIMFKNFFFLNNQPDALIKTLHVSGNFSAHHQEFSTVHSALVSFMQIFYDRFQAVRIKHRLVDNSKGNLLRCTVT